MSKEGLYQFFCKLHGEHPIFIRKVSVLTEKLAEEAHILTIHVGVILTIAKTRSEYWISSLR